MYYSKRFAQPAGPRTQESQHTDTHPTSPHLIPPHLTPPTSPQPTHTQTHTSPHLISPVHTPPHLTLHYHTPPHPTTPQPNLPLPIRPPLTSPPFCVFMPLFMISTFVLSSFFGLDGPQVQYCRHFLAWMALKCSTVVVFWPGWP